MNYPYTYSTNAVESSGRKTDAADAFQRATLLLAYDALAASRTSFQVNCTLACNIVPAKHHTQSHITRRNGLIPCVLHIQITMHCNYVQLIFRMRMRNISNSLSTHLHTEIEGVHTQQIIESLMNQMEGWCWEKGIAIRGTLFGASEMGASSAFRLHTMLLLYFQSPDVSPDVQPELTLSISFVMYSAQTLCSAASTV